MLQMDINVLSKMARVCLFIKLPINYTSDGVLSFKNWLEKDNMFEFEVEKMENMVTIREEMSKLERDNLRMGCALVYGSILILAAYHMGFKFGEAQKYDRNVSIERIVYDRCLQFGDID